MIMSGRHPGKDQDVTMDLTKTLKVRCSFMVKAETKYLNEERIRFATCSGMSLNLTVRPGWPDDFSDDPIILQPPSATTSLSLHPWCRIPACCPLTPSCADIAGMCPRS